MSTNRSTDDGATRPERVCRPLTDKQSSFLGSHLVEESGKFLTDVPHDCVLFPGGHSAQVLEPPARSLLLIDVFGNGTVWWFHSEADVRRLFSREAI